MKNIDIFTDGSHIKSGSREGRLGIGGILVIDNRLINQFSMEVDPKVIKENYGTDDVSNPTMEIYAVLESLNEFKSDITSDDIINFYADYKGVTEWLTGNWKINKPYIRQIYDDIKNITKVRNLHIKYNWVKGHSSGTDYYSIWNKRVDDLANPK